MLYMLKNACTFAPEFKIKPNMKDKIFNALKQEYARLGLGDNILLGLAEMLAGTSLVTEENLQGIVAGQKAYLEDLQKSNDKRVQEAVDKTQKEATDKADAAAKQHKAAVEKLQKEYDDYKTAHPGKQPETPPAEDKEMPEWYKKEKAEREKQEREREQAIALREKEWQDKLDAIEKARSESEAKFKAIEDAKKVSDEKLKAIEDARTKAEKERAANLRRETINGKAKEKGIPDWMIAHGFADITDDADDAKIDEILSRYANEIQTNLLPGRNSIPAYDGKQATKADTDSMVAKLFPSAQKK